MSWTRSESSLIVPSAPKAKRISFSPPYCHICKDEVDRFEIHYFPIEGSEDRWIELVAYCHGQVQAQKILESDILMLERRGAFKDPRFSSFKGRVLSPDKLNRRVI